MNYSKDQKSRTDRSGRAKRKLLRQNMSGAREVLGETLAARTKAWLETLTREFSFSLTAQA